jgi:hypothetical protein
MQGEVKDSAREITSGHVLQQGGWQRPRSTQRHLAQEHCRYRAMAMQGRGRTWARVWAVAKPTNPTQIA